MNRESFRVSGNPARCVPFRDYFACLLLVLVSGNPALTINGSPEPYIVAIAAVMAGMLAVAPSRVWKTPRRAPQVFLVFGLLIAFHVVSFKFAPIITILGFLTRLFIGFAGMALISDFPLTYPQVLFHTAVISLAVYVPDQLMRAAGVDGGLEVLLPSVAHVFSTDRVPSIGIYTFVGAAEGRNSGPFWEPTAFAGYLVLALCFLALRQQNAGTRPGYWGRALVIGAALLTTLSTTGYAAFAVAAVVAARNVNWPARDQLVRFVLKTAVVAVFSVAGWKAFDALPFLQTKTESQYTSVVEQKRGWEDTRFGAVLFDWEYIRTRPISGWGLNPRTRYALHPGQEDIGERLGNGLSDFAARFGLAGVLLFLTCAWKGVTASTGASRSAVGMALVAILVVLNGEMFLSYPVFLSLMFLKGPALPTQCRG